MQGFEKDVFVRHLMWLVCLPTDNSSWIIGNKINQTGIYYQAYYPAVFTAIKAIATNTWVWWWHCDDTFNIQQITGNRSEKAVFRNIILIMFFVVLKETLISKQSCNFHFELVDLYLYKDKIYEMYNYQKHNERTAVTYKSLYYGNHHKDQHFNSFIDIKRINCF